MKRIAEDDALDHLPGEPAEQHSEALRPRPPGPPPWKLGAYLYIHSIDWYEHGIKRPQKAARRAAKAKARTGRRSAGQRGLTFSRKD